MDTIETRQLQCMEIWGGNHAVSTALAMPGLDTWIYSRPHGGAEGGGDVHYASSCATGALARMLVADVAGHGASVADTARRLRKLMRRHVNQHDQTRLVRSLNREFPVGPSQDGHFATAIAFSYDAPLNRLQVCNAGHPPPLVYRRATQRWHFLDLHEDARTHNIPLGIDDVAEFGEADVAIDIGDIVLSYTDALLEFRLHSGGRMNRAGLLELVSETDVSNPSRIIPDLLERVERVGTIDDDLTILLFRFNGTRQRVPLTDFLLAPVKYVCAVTRSMMS